MIASSTIVVPRREDFDVLSDAVARGELEAVLDAFRVAIDRRPQPADG